MQGWQRRPKTRGDFVTQKTKKNKENQELPGSSVWSIRESSIGFIFMHRFEVLAAMALKLIWKNVKKGDKVTPVYGMLCVLYVDWVLNVNEQEVNFTRQQ